MVSDKHGNFEAVIRVAPPIVGQGDHLEFAWIDSSGGGRWSGPFPIMVDGHPITGVTGDPVLIQSSWGNVGNFELFVPQGNVINHYYRDNDDPDLAWHLVNPPLAYLPRVPKQLVGTPRSVTFIQSNFKGDNKHGNFEAVIRVAPPIVGQGDHLEFAWIDSSGGGRWSGPFPIMVDGHPITGETGDPVLIQSSWGNVGNFELFVPQGNVINHYYRDNEDPGKPWKYADQLWGPQAATGGPINPTPKGVSAIQSSFFSDGFHGNFTAVVQLTSAPSPSSFSTNQRDYLDRMFVECWRPAPR